jgi:hypothetical protein
VSQKIKLFAIDNNEVERQGNLKEIIQIFQGSFEYIETQVVSAQSNLIELNEIQKFIKVMQVWILKINYSLKFRIKRKLKFSQIVVDTIKDVLQIFTIFIKFKSLYKKILIEMNLTQKHLYCWRDQVQKSLSTSIIIENDLSWKTNSNKTIENLKYAIKRNNFVMFGHSVIWVHLMLDNISNTQSANLKICNRIVSNGTSGYLLPLEITELFLEVVTKMPNLTLLTPDYLIVALGIELEKLGQTNFQTVFLYPSDFIPLSGSIFNSEVQI